MSERAKDHYEGCTILVTEMSDCYVKNIFEDPNSEPIPDVPYSPLQGGTEGAIADARKFIDDRNAKRVTPR